MKNQSIAIAFLISVPALEAQVMSGPMVGHTTDESCLIWVQDAEAEILTVNFWPAESGEDSSEEAVIRPRRGSPGVFLGQLEGLAPRTKYEFKIGAAGGESSRGSFVTAPPQGKPAKFRYALTSCIDFKQFPVQEAWGQVRREKPDFHLMVGDNVYADSTGYEVLWEHHLKQRSVKGFDWILANVPNYATWDDHDFGPNDSHAGTAGKETSLRAFRDVWANPSYGTEEIPGVFYSFKWADVDYFVMDGRYHRTDERAPNSPQKTQFGRAQRAWLFEQLKASRAPFKVVVNGYDIMSSKYPDELKVIAGFVKEHRISGVLFHSGDIHRNEFKQQDHGMGYPVTQITSSGIARNKIRPWAMIEVDTTLEDPSLSFRFFEEEKLNDGKTIRLSELTP
ncbi:alkaline phosphatase D family protein [Haloferula sp.]|uniref:alkaline phosphatase D family protein n=1 Tax=Haloferula sp. TaxID=2497595 RepID=UPI003C78F41F